MNTRTMLTLPALSHGQFQWRLPLCDATALALASAAVERDVASRVAQWCSLLAVDPALAVWAISNRWLSSVLKVSADFVCDDTLTIVALANWLSSGWINQIQWHGGDDQLVSLSDEQHGRSAALVAESVGAAYQIIHSQNSDDAFTRPDFLAALTRRWTEWFDLSRTDPAKINPSLPIWPLAGGNAAGLIIREDDTEVRAKADEAWRRWLTEIPMARKLLPALMEQTRRFDELQSHFDEQLHIAKLGALKEFAYGAGHELNNPLANIASRAQTLLTEESQPERRRRLAAINSQAFRAHEMLADLMLFARPPQLTLDKVDVVLLVGEVLAELAEMAAAQQTLLHAPIQRDPLWIDADPIQLHVAIKALCINSIESLVSGGNMTVELCVSDIPATTAGESGGELVEISISDDGPGIPPEFRDKLFDPFFSGREANRGLGFGLCKCWRIVNLHNGRINLRQQPGPGSTFTITLPCSASLCCPPRGGSL